MLMQTLSMPRETWPVQSLEFTSSEVKMQTSLTHLRMLESLFGSESASRSWRCHQALCFSFGSHIQPESQLSIRTLEFFQKVLLGLDAQKLSHKIQILNNKLVD